MGKASQGLRTATGTPTTAQLSGIPTHCGGVRRRSVEEDCELPASATSYRELLGEIKAYLHARARKHGHVRTAEAFGVSRHTLWRFLERGQPGRALPRAVMAQAGKTAEAIAAATRVLDGEARPSPRDRADPFLPRRLREALLALCETPFASVDELSRLRRVSVSTLRGRLAQLGERGLADARPHRLTALGSRPQRRYFPTAAGVAAASTPTPRSSSGTRARSAGACSSTSGAPPRRSGCPSGWRRTAANSRAATRVPTTRGRTRWCCSCSRRGTQRRSSCGRQPACRRCRWRAPRPTDSTGTGCSERSVPPGADPPRMHQNAVPLGSSATSLPYNPAVPGTSGRGTRLPQRCSTLPHGKRPSCLHIRGAGGAVLPTFFSSLTSSAPNSPECGKWCNTPRAA